MKKFTAAVVCAAILFSLSVFSAGASSIQSQILSLIEENPVSSEDPGELLLSANPSQTPVDASNIRDLYSISKKIVSLSIGLNHSEGIKI